MDKDKLRPVEAQVYQDQNTPNVKGYFHKWFEDGNYQQCALIEDEDGKMLSTLARCVRFLDRN